MGRFVEIRSFKFRSKTINFANFVKFVEDLANQKKIDPQELKDKLANCGLPGTANTTVIAYLPINNSTKASQLICQNHVFESGYSLSIFYVVRINVVYILLFFFAHRHVIHCLTSLKVFNNILKTVLFISRKWFYYN